MKIKHTKKDELDQDHRELIHYSFFNLSLKKMKKKMF